MLTRMNNEAKVRRSTQLIVLGKARVMSLEDIEAARAARAVKDAIKGKGKRGRKRKSAALEADELEPEANSEPEADSEPEPETEPEPEPEVARAAKETIKGRRKCGLLYLTTKAFYELKVSQCLKGVRGNKESVREKKGVGMGHGSGGVRYHKGRMGMDRVSALRRIV